MRAAPKLSPHTESAGSKAETIDIVVTRNRQTKARVRVKPQEAFGDVKPENAAEIDVAAGEQKAVEEAAKQEPRFNASGQKEQKPKPIRPREPTSSDKKSNQAAPLQPSSSSSEGEVEIIYNEKQSHDRIAAHEGEVMSGQT